MRVVLTQTLYLNVWDQLPQQATEFDFLSLTSAYQYARDNLDFGPYSVLINDNRPVSTEAFTAHGPCVGQVLTANLRVIGTAPGGCLRQPTTGRCFGAEDQARFCFENFILDQANNDGANDSSTVTVGHYSEISQGAGVEFRNAAYAAGQPGYHVQACFLSHYQISAPFVLRPTAKVVNSSFNTQSAQLGLSNPAGIKPYMGVQGIGNDACFVQSINGAVVTLGGGLPGFSSGYSAVTFTAGICALVQGDPSSFSYAHPVICTVYGKPYFTDAVFSCDKSAIYAQGIQFRDPGGALLPASFFKRAFALDNTGPRIDATPNY